MKLARVHITNFRSIEDIEVDFDKDFKILVGKNECGKTNILKALSFLDPKVKVESDDLREPLPEEDNYSQAQIRFIFNLSDEEKNNIIEEFEKLFFVVTRKKK